MKTTRKFVFFLKSVINFYVFLSQVSVTEGEKLRFVPGTAEKTTAHQQGVLRG